MNDDFCISRRLEQAAALYQFAAKRHRVGKITVVRDGESARCEIGEKRLDISDNGIASRRVAIMADGGRSGQLSDNVFLTEIVANMTGCSVAKKLAVLIGNDPSGFLSAVLQRVQP